MGCCFGKSTEDDYEQLVNTISLHDKVFPTIPDTVIKLRDCTPNHEAQLQKLFSLFDDDSDGFLTQEDLESGIRKVGKTPSQKMLDRCVKQMHLSGAPAEQIDYKGFAMAILSRRSHLFDYLYTDFDTLDEFNAEQESKKRTRGWFG